MTNLPVYLILAIIIACYILLKLFTSKPKNKEGLGSTILPANRTVKLDNLPVGTTIITLDVTTTLPTVQFIHDYQEGMRTNTFKNTFFLEGFGSEIPERLKTFEVIEVGKAKIKILYQIAMMIFPDGSFG
ncbi:MAG: hypothetical protein RL641_818 [Candidatus Parcubacteria bacterium]|jgi:hypothetical protein